MNQMLITSGCSYIKSLSTNVDMRKNSSRNWENRKLCPEMTVFMIDGGAASVDAADALSLDCFCVTCLATVDACKKRNYEHCTESRTTARAAP